MNYKELNDLLSSLRGMENRTGKRDKEITRLIETEISKITKADYEDLSLVEDKNLDFFINKKIQILKKIYRRGEEISDEEYASEIADLTRLKLKIFVDIQPEQVGQILGK